MLNVLIAEDDLLLRKGLEFVIDSEEDMRVVGSAQDGYEVLELIRQSTPDLILMDVKMPRMDGITCIKEIRKSYLYLPILILTTFNEEEFIMEGLAYGANGYLIKGVDFNQLLQSIRHAANHQFILPAEVAVKVARHTMVHSPFLREKKVSLLFEHNPLFSEKEQQIISMLLSRLSNKEIADQLSLSEGTVKNNLSAIYNKLGVQNRLEAINQIENLIANLSPVY